MWVSLKRGLLLLLIQGSMWANEIEVTNLNDSGVGSFREALTQAEEDDQILFDASLAGGTLTLLSDLPKLDRDLTIEGPLAGNVTIDGNDNYRVFHVGAGRQVEISRLHVSSAFIAGSGAGLFLGIGSEVSFSHGVFAACTATGSGGGAVHVGIDAALTLEEVTFSGNSSGGPGKDLFLSAGSAVFVLSETTPAAINIFGIGQIVKQGAALVALDVDAPTALSLVVEKGKVAITGVLTEPVIVYGTLEGDVDCAYLVNQGTVTLSQTIGTLENYWQNSQAILEVPLTPSGSATLQVGKDAYVQGTLSLSPEPGVYHVGQVYTILTAGGGVNFQLGQVVSSSMVFIARPLGKTIEVEITAL